MTTTPSGRRTLSVEPACAVPGGRVVIRGAHLPLPRDGWPHVLVGGVDARVIGASSSFVRIIVPERPAKAVALSPIAPVTIDEFAGEVGAMHVGATIVSDVHHVDSPLFDRAGALYVTRSGSRSERPTVPLSRIAPDGSRTDLSAAVGNPTSLAMDAEGAVYVSSRFDGVVYKLVDDERADVFCAELGVPTGLAFSKDGDLYVGDRSGTIFKVRSDRQVETFASLPSSIAAFHLTFGPDDCLYVTAPTLAARDALYRISPDRMVDVVTETFGRPQGLAFGPDGALYVVDALAGDAGVFRVDVSGDGGSTPVLVAAASALVGIAFGPDGHAALASSETVWKLDGMLRPPVEA